MEKYQASPSKSIWEASAGENPRALPSGDSSLSALMAELQLEKPKVKSLQEKVRRFLEEENDKMFRKQKELEDRIRELEQDNAKFRCQETRYPDILSSMEKLIMKHEKNHQLF